MTIRDVDGVVGRVVVPVEGGVEGGEIIAGCVFVVLGEGVIGAVLCKR